MSSESGMQFQADSFGENKNDIQKVSTSHAKYGPHREKTCLRGFLKSEFQTSLLSYADWLENCNFTCSKFTYDTFHKGAYQTARMCRLVCTCVVRKPPKTGFLATRPI